MSEWQPIDIAPKDQIICGRVVDVRPYRWKPYTPTARRQLHKDGRWQRMSSHGWWENCDPPDDWMPLPESPK